MRRKILCAGLVASFAVVLYASAADAATLGLTAPPAGSTGTPCGSGQVLVQISDDSATPYIVPSSGGQVVRWQVDTTGAAPGQGVTFVVLRNTTLGAYSVVAADAETLPNPLPANHVASFTLAAPIAVQDGDTFGLYTNAVNGLSCYWSGGSTPLGDFIGALTEGSPPASGQTLNPFFGDSPPGFALNLATTLGVSLDAGVSTSAEPADPTTGQATVLTSTVTNHGPGTDTITFTDTVPSGLAVTAASAGDGACTTTGQTINCTITGLASGASVPVNVVVKPGAAGSYINRVGVGVPPEDTDSVTANNSGSATLAVGSPPRQPRCTVPKLKGTPIAVAKTVLRDLGCKLKVKHKHSSVRKGLVIGTHPGPGKYRFHKTVTLKVSSGKKH